MPKIISVSWKAFQEKSFFSEENPILQEKKQFPFENGRIYKNKIKAPINRYIAVQIKAKRLHLINSLLLKFQKKNKSGYDVLAWLAMNVLFNKCHWYGMA